MNVTLFKRLLRYYGISLALLLVLRLVFIGVHYVSGFGFVGILKAIGIGLIIDSSVMSCCVIACFLMGWLLSFASEKVGKTTMTVMLALSLLTVLVVNVVDIFYYSHYNTRQSYNIFSYFMENFSNNFRMLWKDFPLPWVILGAVAAWLILWVWTKRMLGKVTMRHKPWLTLLCVLLTFGVLSFLYYGAPFWRLATFSSHAALNQASGNGVYTLVKSYAVTHSSKRDLFPFEESKVMEDLDGNLAFVCSNDDILLDPQAPTLRKFRQPKKCTSPKNVVIIVCESFSATLTGVLGQDDRSYSPCFDTLCHEGALFSNCFANGQRTQHGIVSVLSGVPSVIGSSLIRRRETNTFFTIADALNPFGYETNFIHGGDVDYDDMRDYLRQGGFQHIYGVEDFDQWRFKNDWGVCDEDLFDFAFQKISATDGPHLSVILTMSNHHPYDIPPYFSETHPEVLDFPKPKATFYYVDHAFASFIEKMKRLPEYENTLILRIADHGEVFFPDDYQFRFFHIPALLLNGTYRDTVFPQLCSQMDFAPTIFAEMGFEGAFPCMGRNLFADDYRPFATMNTLNNLHFWMENGKVVSWDMMNDESRCYRMNASYLLEPFEEPFDAELERMKSYLAFLSYLYQKGLFNDSSRR